MENTNIVDIDEIEEYLPDEFYTSSAETRNNIIRYIMNMNSIEKKAYSIGKEHLKTSFSVTKSNGYKEFIKK